MSRCPGKETPHLRKIRMNFLKKMDVPGCPGLEKKNAPLRLGAFFLTKENDNL